MIPASYFFRRINQDRFAAVEPQEPPPAYWPGRLALDQATAAILGFAYGMPGLTLGAGGPHRHGRRR